MSTSKETQALFTTDLDLGFIPSPCPIAKRNQVFNPISNKHLSYATIATHGSSTQTPLRETLSRDAQMAMPSRRSTLRCRWGDQTQCHRFGLPPPLLKGCSLFSHLHCRRPRWQLVVEIVAAAGVIQPENVIPTTFGRDRGEDSDETICVGGELRNPITGARSDQQSVPFLPGRNASAGSLLHLGFAYPQRRQRHLDRPANPP